MKTIIKKGKILQPGGIFVEALAINDGVVIAAGTNLEITAMATVNTEIIDAQGKLVIPGFNDSHLHLATLGNFLTSVPCYGLTSIEAIIEKGRAFIKNNQIPAGEVVIGTGWNQDNFVDNQRILTRHDLDKISTEHPLIFKRACIHICVCNTKALEMAGVTADMLQPENGFFEIGADGKPNGVFREKAQLLVKILEPEVSLEMVKRHIKVAANHAIAHGLTSVQANDLTDDAADYPFILQAYQELIAANELPVRINLQCCFNSPASFQAFIDEGYYTGYGDNRLKIGPLKMFTDGSLGARTALMRAPYNDDPTTKGVEVMTQAEITTMVEIADANKFQVIVHAIGDEAICRVLTSYEHVYDMTTNNPLRHGINHCQITDYPMLERFKSANVLAYLQPIFLHSDLHIVEDRVGETLASTSYAFNTMEQMGIITAYGTDAPVEDLDPFACLHCAVNRQDMSGFPESGFYPNERVSIAKAIERYTEGSAYAAFEEHIKGTLAPGMLADLVILSQDLYTIPTDQIKDTQAVLTMVDGDVVYTCS